MSRAEARRGLALNLMGLEALGDGSFEAVLDAARLADELGVDALVGCDHLALNVEEYRDRAGFPYALSANWYEPIATLSAIAAVTHRARLGASVIVAPLRPALLLAKQLATVDAISNGRLDVAIGAGWQRAEFLAAGMPFEGRFGAMVETIQACRELWGSAPASFHGRTVRFDDMVSLPLPPQGRELALALGVALTPLGVQRILDLGVGWAPAPLPPEELAAGIATLSAAAAERGGHRPPVRVTAVVPIVGHAELAAGAAPVHPLETVEALWQAGADVVTVHVQGICRSLDELPGFLAPLLDARDRA